MTSKWTWPSRGPGDAESLPPIRPRHRPAMPSVVTDVFEGTIPEDDTPDILDVDISAESMIRSGGDCE